MKKFPTYIQLDAKDCGPTCIKIIAEYYGSSIDIKLLREYSETTRDGSRLTFLSAAAEKIGFRTLAARIHYHKIKEAPLPCILYWESDHYVVLYKIKGDIFYISDPAKGLVKFKEAEFIKYWIGENISINEKSGVLLLLESTPLLHSKETEVHLRKNTYSLKFIMNYVWKYKKYMLQIFIGLLITSIIQIIFPFLTQNIVDIGIKYQNLKFIYLVLFAQLFLFLSKTATEIVRGWLLLHLSARIRISLIADFFVKLMRLPIAFFDVRKTGDIIQRIQDHKRVENLLTNSVFEVVLSIISIIILGIVLGTYNTIISLIFFIGSLFHMVWVMYFLPKRKVIDNELFQELSIEQTKVLELIQGMQEIKLHNAERKMRWGWEFIQSRIFKISLKSLKLQQVQSVGASFATELTNIITLFISATLVIENQITIGSMLAINSVVGSLNLPIHQLINFFKDLQDVKISLSRLSEIYDKKDEKEEDQNIRTKTIDVKNSITLNEVYYRYPGTKNNVLDGLNLIIPKEKITAIVGESGSGKTTLMKILLKFYKVNKGTISIGKTSLNDISQYCWRNNVGAVMQDGFIFNDSIENNIACSEEEISKERLLLALSISNLNEFVNRLPKGIHTIVGSEGIGLSGGQKQRILIARLVYKNPSILLFDEATSSLDANNEKIIISHLNDFFKGKTVVIIAHRLSTVVNADQIVVLNKGRIEEIGTHNDLIIKRGKYFELIKNQLELGI